MIHNLNVKGIINIKEYKYKKLKQRHYNFIVRNKSHNLNNIHITHVPIDGNI